MNTYYVPGIVLNTEGVALYKAALSHVLTGDAKNKQTTNKKPNEQINVYHNV